MNPKILYFICLTLLALSLLSNVFFYKQLKNTDKQINGLTLDKQTILDQYQLLQRDLTRTTANLIAIRNINNEIIHLLPTTDNKENIVTIYWNKKNRHTYIDANNLPIPPGDHQYQVWEVLEDKAYHSLGVFNYQTDKDNLFKINRATIGKKFLVTLELMQGSKQPTLSRIYVRN